MENNQLIIQTNENNIPAERAKNLNDIFTPFFIEAEQLKKEAAKINITSIDQTEDMAMARNIRLYLKDIRVKVEKVRVDLKEDSKREGKAIDGMSNVIKYLIQPIEKHLKDQEDFVKLQEEKRVNAIVEDREKKLIGGDADITLYDLKNMEDGTFNTLLENTTRLYNIKKTDEAKEAADRIQKEKADREKSEKLQKENDRLKKEADERGKSIAKGKKTRELKAIEFLEGHQFAKDEHGYTAIEYPAFIGTKAYNDFETDKELELFISNIEQEAKRFKEAEERKAKEKIERDKQEAILKAEKQKRENAEAELKATNDKEREERERLEKQEAEKKQAEDAKQKALLMAPDKKKLEMYSLAIVSVPAPAVESDEAQAILKTAIELLNEASNYLTENICNL